MQIVLEAPLECQVRIVPPNPVTPEGAVSIVFTEGGVIKVPLTMPRLQATHLAMQILAATKGGDSNGGILPPAEPIYGADEDGPFE